MNKEEGSKSCNDLEKSISQKLSELNFEEAFELTGHGRFNTIVLLACGLVLLNVTMESVGVGYVVTAAEHDLGLTATQKGIISASAFIGIMSTSFLWGYLSDKLGRRAVMVPCITISAALSVASSFSSNWWMLLILRILTGCFISASSATVYAYLGELHVNARRSAAIAWGCVFISIAFIVLPGLAWLIIPGTWTLPLFSATIKPWQVLIWWWCLPGLSAAMLLALLPESPKFLVANGRPEEALEVLATMYAWNLGGKKEDFPVKKITQTDESRQSGFTSRLDHFFLLFRPPLLRCTVISHVAMFSVFLLSSGLYLWVPDILNSVLYDRSQQGASICHIIHAKVSAVHNASSLQRDASEVSEGVFPISMAMGAVFAMTYFAIGFLINKIGRAPLFCGIMMICGVATAAAAFVPHSGAATALLILALCSGCAGSILAAIGVDVYPTSMRAMAMCVMYMLGRAGAAVGAYIMGLLLENHCHLAFSVFGAAASVSALLILFWPNPEKVREEIEKKGLSY